MVQEVLTLPNETGMNLTIAKYLTPNGNDINKKGIAPDVQIALTQQDLKKNNDAQLEVAKNMLQDMIKKEEEKVQK